MPKLVAPVIEALANPEAKFKSPLTITLLRTPVELVKLRFCPFSKVTLPPLIVPLTIFHEPVKVLRVSVLPVLLIVPVTLTVPPPVLRMFPSPAGRVECAAEVEGRTIDDDRAAVGVGAAGDRQDAAVEGLNCADVGKGRRGDGNRSAADFGADQAVVGQVHRSAEGKPGAANLAVAGEAGCGLHHAGRADGEGARGDHVEEPAGWRDAFEQDGVVERRAGDEAQIVALAAKCAVVKLVPAPMATRAKPLARLKSPLIVSPMSDPPAGSQNQRHGRVDGRVGDRPAGQAVRAGREVEAAGCGKRAGGVAQRRVGAVERQAVDRRRRIERDGVCRAGSADGHGVGIGTIVGRNRRAPFGRVRPVAAGGGEPGVGHVRRASVWSAHRNGGKCRSCRGGTKPPPATMCTTLMRSMIPTERNDESMHYSIPSK